MTCIYYYSYEHDAETKLLNQAELASQSMNETKSDERAQVLEEQISGSIRYTLITSSGEVLFDSSANKATLGDHHERPEVLEAEQAGKSMVVRYSETLKTDTIYAAVRLDDAGIIRLSETRESLAAFLGSMLFPMVIALVVVAAAVFFLSKTLTKRIMRPIDALDFAQPLDNEIYAEMNPLLERIDKQQQQLKQQNEELARAENIRRDFSSNVSHEMKTPLQVISGYAELMKNDMIDPADRQKFAALIYEEAQAMRLLINDVLTLSRLDESSFSSEAATTIDLLELAKRIAARLESFAADRQVRIEVYGCGARISGSETLAEEMLYDLIENGIRYNCEGGNVSVEINTEDDQAVLRVSDTGFGIPEDMQDKVFERFFRVDKSRSKETGGTGLGLAIVKHAVLYHQGSIDVESQEGKGTTFTVRISCV